MVERIRRGLLAWLGLARVMEMTLVDAIAATAPWLAPVAPAYLSWRNMQSRLEMPALAALAVALAVEFIGISAVSTVMAVAAFNRGRKDRHAPMWAAGLASGGYFAVVLSLNAVLDVERLSWSQLISVVMLSSLSIFAALTLAARSMLARRQEEIQEERREKRENRQLRKDAELSGKVRESSGWQGQAQPLQDATRPQQGLIQRVDWRKMSEVERADALALDDEVIMAQYRVTDKTVRNWRKRAPHFVRDASRGNGHG